MRNITQSDETESALADIYLYAEKEWGAKQASRYIQQFLEAFDRLAKQPGLGHWHPEVPEPYRTYAVGGHVAVYRADARTLFIVAVFHGAMNIAVRMESLANKYH